MSLKAHLLFKKPLTNPQQYSVKKKKKKEKSKKKKIESTKHKSKKKKEINFMGSKEQKITLLNQQLEQLGSITNSPSVNKTSIIAHASKYIEELKERIDKLNEDVSTSQPSRDDDEDSLPAVTVETLEKGFIINVFSEKNCPGLLVSILEAFEELGIELSDARVSCSDSFRLEAVSDNEGQIECVDAQMVKQAVLEVVRNWSQSNEQDKFNKL